MYCSKCGKEMPAGAKFCQHCGKSIENKPLVDVNQIVDQVKRIKTENISFEPKELLKEALNRAKKVGIDFRKYIALLLLTLICTITVNTEHITVEVLGAMSKDIFLRDMEGVEWAPGFLTVLFILSMISMLMPVIKNSQIKKSNLFLAKTAGILSFVYSILNYFAIHGSIEENYDMLCKIIVSFSGYLHVICGAILIALLFYITNILKKASNNRTEGKENGLG